MQTRKLRGTKGPECTRGKRTRVLKTPYRAGLCSSVDDLLLFSCSDPLVSTSARFPCPWRQFRGRTGRGMAPRSLLSYHPRQSIQGLLGCFCQRQRRMESRCQASAPGSSFPQISSCLAWKQRILRPPRELLWWPLNFSWTKPTGPSLG